MSDGPGSDALAVSLLGGLAWRAHPVERLVSAVCDVNGDRPVGRDQDQPRREGEVCVEATVVVDAAARNDQTHEHEYGECLEPWSSRIGDGEVRRAVESGTKMGLKMT